MFELFTEAAIRVIQIAQEEARRFGQSFIGTEQLLLGLLREQNSIAAQVLLELGATPDATTQAVEQIVGTKSNYVPAEIPFTPAAKKLLERAIQEVRQLGQRAVAPEHLLLALTQDRDGVAAKILDMLEIDPAAVRRRTMQRVGEEAAVLVGSPTRSSARSMLLDEFGTNLTQLANTGKLDPVVGRQTEIERVVQILGRRTKSNPILIGEPGVGKTAIAEGLAQRIVQHDVPDILQDKQVFSLDMGRLVAGTRFRGEFEERLKAIVEEVRTSGNIILVIDEIHTLVGGGALGGSLDAANMLKPALARGELQCLGATTLDEYRQYIERDPALERRFQPVMVGEPSVADTIEILYGLRQTYEQFHQVEITNAAIVAAAELSDRYIADRHLPDKAIDLLDEAGSRLRLRRVRFSPEEQALKQELRQVSQSKEAAVEVQDFEQAGQLRDRELELQSQLQTLTAQRAETTTNMPLPVVDVDEIATIVSAWTGVPVNKLTETESEQLLRLEDTLHQRLIGQNEAVAAVARAMRRARVGLKHPGRPIASFIFSGPTGVGKTELAKSLAAYFFGSEEAMVRIDMSEYMERHTVSKLIGAPPGFVGYGEGGELTEAVRRKPYSVVLFDEIEKAHPDVFNLLLQVLDDGHLTDSQGRTVSFKNALIIMTSNIGSRVIEKGGAGLGFELAGQTDGEAQYTRIRNSVQEELKQVFRPEFLNRLDDIIVFRQLTQPEILQIATIMLRNLGSRLEEQNIRLQVSEAVKQHLVAQGYSPAYGARSLRRVITQLLEDVLAEAMLSGRVSTGDTAQVDLDIEGTIQVAAVKHPQLQPAV
jgi:ATP-dependent Clp protease ATP-binding subunit ClpC